MRTFDLSSIWRSQAVDDDLTSFCQSLMILMNDLIKKYSKSDDYGEYSKKEELWQAISDCDEIEEFMSTDDAQKILAKYTVSIDAAKKRSAKKKSCKPVDFSHVAAQAKIYSNGEQFYSALKHECQFYLDDTHMRRLEAIISAMQSTEDIPPEYVEFESNLTRKLQQVQPTVFDRIASKDDDIIPRTLQFIMQKYNNAIENDLDVKSEFIDIADYGARKGVRYSSIYREIGTTLHSGNPPSIKQLMYARYYVEMGLHHKRLVSISNRQQ